MWKKNSPIPGRGHLPYRGQSEPKFFRSSERRFRNLAAEKRESIATVTILTLIGISLVVVAVYFYDPYADNLAFGALLAGASFFFMLAIGIANAIRNVNKFRPGHDVDTSMMDDDAKEKTSEEDK